MDAPEAPLKIKVLLITKDTEIFSPSLSRERILDYAKRAGEIHVVVLNTRNEIFDEGKIGENVFIYPTNSFSKLSFIIDALSLIKRKLTWKGRMHTDLICAESPYTEGLVGMVLSKKYRKRLFVEVKEDFSKVGIFNGGIKGFVKGIVAEFVAHTAVGIRVLNNDVFESLIKHFNYLSKKMTVLPEFIDIKRISELPVSIDLHKKYPIYTFIILMHASHVKNQNINLAINTMSMVARAFPRTLLLIVGDGPYKSSLWRTANRIGIPGNVIFEPETKDIWSYFKTANLALVTAENSPNDTTSLEALACSCPVITTNTGVAAKVLHDIRGVNFVCEKVNVDCFAEKIRQFINEPGVREHFRLNAIGYAREVQSYGKDEYLDRHYDLWEACFRG